MISEIRGVVGGYRAVSGRRFAALEPVILGDIRRVLASRMDVHVSRQIRNNDRREGRGVDQPR